MKVGYVRVSTLEQNEERQILKMRENGIDKLFIEHMSGKNIEDRKELQNMLEFVRDGDTIYIHDFSRIARSVKDLLEIVELLKNKGVSLVSFKESIDTSTSTGKLMLTMLGAIYEFERDNILERQREGIELAKLNKKYKGRKAISYPENWEFIYDKWKKREITGRKAKELLKLKHSTFYKLVKKHELKVMNKGK